MAQSHTFKGTARRIINTPDGFITKAYQYHYTSIVSLYKDGRIELNSGGYRTATTKRAMNQASNQDGLGFQVFQKNYDWFVTWQGKDLPFEDGMFLTK